jgi:predicted kinase
VAVRTAADPLVDEAVRAQQRLAAARLLALAWSFARAGAPGALLLLHGFSGTGKSVLASKIAPWLCARVLRSDLVRKELLGLAPTDRPRGAAREEAYGPAASERTYAELLRRGVACVRAGRAALLDATWLRRDGREEARRAAAKVGAPFAILDVTCPSSEVRRRLAERSARDEDASDADWRIHEEQVRTAEALEPAERAVAVTFPSGEPPEARILALLEALEVQTDARREALGPAWA